MRSETEMALDMHRVQYDRANRLEVERDLARDVAAQLMEQLGEDGIGWGRCCVWHDHLIPCRPGPHSQGLGPCCSDCDGCLPASDLTFPSLDALLGRPS